MLFAKKLASPNAVKAENEIFSKSCEMAKRSSKDSHRIGIKFKISAGGIKADCYDYVFETLYSENS